MAVIDSITVDIATINMPLVQTAFDLIARMSKADPAEVECMGTGAKEAYHEAGRIAGQIRQNDDRKTLVRLPSGFKLEDAREALGWPGTMQGLASYLLHLGFSPTLRTERGCARRYWYPTGSAAKQAAEDFCATAVPLACESEDDRAARMAACPCPCHENRCGSAEIAMAQYALHLIDRCPSTEDAVAIDEIVQRAGPEFAIAALARIERSRSAFDNITDEEVPF